MEPEMRACRGLSKCVLGAWKITCVLGPVVERALPGFCGVMGPGPGVKTLWESCSERKDNPRDMGLAEVQLEGRGQTGGGCLIQQEGIGWLKLGMLGRGEEGRGEG